MMFCATPSCCCHRNGWSICAFVMAAKCPSIICGVPPTRGTGSLSAYTAAATTASSSFQHDVDTYLWQTHATVAMDPAGLKLCRVQACMSQPARITCCAASGPCCATQLRLRTRLLSPASASHYSLCSLALQCGMATFAANAAKLHHALAKHDLAALTPLLADDAILHQGSPRSYPNIATSKGCVASRADVGTMAQVDLPDHAQHVIRNWARVLLARRELQLDLLGAS